MPVGGKGPPRKPGASIRGSFIVDTVRGVPRVRPWPKPKPTTPGTPRDYWARYFAAMNRLCKTWHPLWMGLAQRLTAGTPYYPRDLLLMGMYGRQLAVIMPNKQQWWSMANRATVSASLDVLGSAVGSYLRRGADFWEPTSLPPGASGALIYITPTRTNQDYRTPTVLAWDAAAYGSGEWWFPGTDATKLVVPAGISRVEVTAEISLANVTGQDATIVWLLKNGADSYIGRAVDITSVSINDKAMHIKTASLPVAEGDNFQILIRQITDSAITLNAQASWFAIRPLA